MQHNKEGMMHILLCSNSRLWMSRCALLWQVALTGNLDLFFPLQVVGIFEEESLGQHSGNLQTVEEKRKGFESQKYLLKSITL